MIRARQNYPSFALALSQPPSPQQPLVGPAHRPTRRTGASAHSSSRTSSRAPTHQKAPIQDFMKTVDHRFTDYQGRPSKRPRSAGSLSAVDAPSPRSPSREPARPSSTSRSRAASPVRVQHVLTGSAGNTQSSRPASIGDTSDSKSKKPGMLGVVLDLTFAWTKKRKPGKERPEFVRV